MPWRFSTHWVWLPLLSLLFAGCSSSPEQRLVGTWKGDTSAIGMTMKAVKLKNDAPGISNKDAINAAKTIAWS